MKKSISNTSPLGYQDRDGAVAKQRRTSYVILGSHFAFMFLLAFILPTRYEDMPWAVPVVESIAKWAPNLRLVALRTSSPSLVEAYLSIGLIVTLLAAVIGVATIRGRAYVQFGSAAHKGVMVVGAIIFTALISTFFLIPGMVSGELGLLHGRSGAVFGFALSGRLGMATFLNFYCFSGLLLGLIVLWATIKEPVTPVMDFAQYLASTRQKD